MNNTNPRAEKTYTLTLDGGASGATFDITAEMGVIKCSMAALSAVSGALQMSEAITLDSKPSTAIPIAQGTPITITPAKPDGVLDGVRISVPGGGSLAIMCQI